MIQNTEWFAGEEGLGLWAIERNVIRKALPGTGAAQSLLIGPAAHDHELLSDLTFGQSWYFDTVTTANNPWVTDDVSSLPLQDECMDLIVLRHCMDADEKARHLLFDACRVLKPGGHMVLSCLNSSGWVAGGLLRRRKLPRLSAGWIKSVSSQTGLVVEQFQSLGLGGLTNRYASRSLPRAMTALSNLHVCVLYKQHDTGQIRRLVYRLPKRGRAVAANTGIYNKTGT